MILIVAKNLIPKGFRGLTLFPFVFLKFDSDKVNTILVNHEKIHLKQQLELCILPFFIWYTLEYLIKLVYYKNKDLAYRNISFEKEAYTHETDLNYLKNRPLWSFVRFVYKN